MNKADAIEFLKTNGMSAISVSTLDRHRKEGRIGATEVKGKTGMVVDYSQEALMEYLEAELQPLPSVAKALAKPSSFLEPGKTSQSLVRASPQSQQGEIQVLAISDEGSPTLSKPLLDLRQLKAKLVWTLEEASAMTGFPKGRIRDAIDAGELKGKRIGRPFFVRPKDVEEWIESLF